MDSQLQTLLKPKVEEEVELWMLAKFDMPNC